MAEYINWEAARNRVINTGSSYFRNVEWLTAPPEVRARIDQITSHPMASKLRDSTGTFVGEWWANVDPRRMNEKSTAWRIGYAAGALESVALLIFILPPGTKFWAKGVANASVMHSFYAGAKIIHAVQEAAIKRQFAGSPDLDTHLDQLRNDKTRKDAQIKDAFKGVTAGATHFSLISGFGRSLTSHLLGKVDLGGSISAKVGQFSKSIHNLPHSIHFGNHPAEQASSTSTTSSMGSNTESRSTTASHTTSATTTETSPTVSSTSSTPDTPTVSTYIGNLTERQLENALHQAHYPGPLGEQYQAQEVLAYNHAVKTGLLLNNQDFNTTLQSNVGRELPAVDSIIKDYLATEGKTPSDLTPQQLSSLHTSIQHLLERQSNSVGNHVISQVLDGNTSIDVRDPGVIQGINDTVTQQYDQWFSSSVGHNQIADAIHQTLGEATSNTAAPHPAMAPDKLLQFISDNQNNPNLVTTHLVTPGESAGYLVQDMGLPVSWNMTDWQSFATLYDLNPGVFTDIQTSSGLSPAQFQELVSQIRAGDTGAYETLLKYMSGVKAGKVIRLLTPLGRQRFQLIAA